MTLGFKKNKRKTMYQELTCWKRANGRTVMMCLSKLFVEIIFSAVPQGALDTVIDIWHTLDVQSSNAFSPDWLDLSISI